MHAHVPFNRNTLRNVRTQLHLAGDDEHLPSSSATPGGKGALPPCDPLSSTPFRWGEVQAMSSVKISPASTTEKSKSSAQSIIKHAKHAHGTLRQMANK